MRVIGYIRVSTEEQGQEERFSLPHQRDHVAQECKARGWQLLEVYEDTESGKNTKKRPGFNAAMDAMGNAEILVVHELDRLSRNLIDTLLIVDELNKVGKKFVSIHDNIDSSNQQGELQLHILAVFAHYFRRQLGAKVYGSLLTRAQAGGWNTTPPYGYTLINKVLVPDPDTEWVVKKIFNMYLSNIGYLAIAKELNQLGIKSKAGKLWSNQVVKQILVNPAYTGQVVWNKIQVGDSKRKSRPKDNWVVTQNAHTPIIETETFQKVQERIKTKAGLGGRAQNTKYLLSGILYCGYCNEKMAGNTMRFNKARTKSIYVCMGYHKKGSCSRITAEKNEIEEHVLSSIEHLIGSPKEANQILKTKHVDLAALASEKTKIQSEIKALGQRFKRQLEAYEAGVINLSELKEAKERVQRQETTLSGALTKVEDRLLTMDKDEYLRFKLANFYEVFNSGDVLKQKAWLQEKIEKITFYDREHIDITFKS